MQITFFFCASYFMHCLLNKSLSVCAKKLGADFILIEYNGWFVYK